jgi:hypothetical protein
VTVTRQELVRAVAEQTGISMPAAARKVTEVSEEMELAGATEYTERTAGELEAIIVRDLKTT